LQHSLELVSWCVRVTTVEHERVLQPLLATLLVTLLATLQVTMWVTMWVQQLILERLQLRPTPSIKEQHKHRIYNSEEDIGDLTWQKIG